MELLLDFFQEGKFDHGKVSYNREADAVNGIDNPAMESRES